MGAGRKADGGESTPAEGDDNPQRLSEPLESVSVLINRG